MSEASANAGSGSKIIQRFKNVGPGALVAAAFIGPGTVTSCTVSGASYGYTMLWALVFAIVVTIIFQEMAARIGIATQEGLGENIRDRIPNKALKWIAIILVIIAIFIGNVAYETGNITGGYLGLQAIGIPQSAKLIVLIIIGLAAAALLWMGNFKVIQNVLTAIVVIMGLVFMVTAFASSPDWGAVFKGMFMVKLPTAAQAGGTPPILVAVALIATTVVPYNLFLHASSAADRWKNPESIGDARFDAVLSIGLGGVFSMCILICGAANIYGVEGAVVKNGADMAVALTSTLGNWATWLFAIGLFSAGFTSAITAPLAAAYAVNGVLGWKATLKDIKFKAVWGVVLLCGLGMALLGLSSSPTELILVAQAANAIVLPLMAFFVFYCANGKDLGALKNHWFANTMGVVIIILTLFICYRNMSAFISGLEKLIGA